MTPDEIIAGIKDICYKAMKDDPGTEWGNHDKRWMAKDILGFILDNDPNDPNNVCDTPPQ